jgi:hypothetical protein
MVLVSTYLGSIGVVHDWKLLFIWEFMFLKGMSPLVVVRPVFKRVIWDKRKTYSKENKSESESELVSEKPLDTVSLSHFRWRYWIRLSVSALLERLLTDYDKKSKLEFAYPPRLNCLPRTA